MGTPLYRRLLGPSFAQLPAAIRDMHDFQGQRVSTGRTEVRRGTSLLAQWTGDLLRLPRAGTDIPTRVEFDTQFGRERWTRHFGEQELQTHQAASIQKDEAVLVERMGPIAATMRLVLDGKVLRLETRRLTLFGIPLPLALIPQIDAAEFVRAGLFRFDVRVSLPFIGLLIHYRGFLIPLVKATESVTRQQVVTEGPVMMFDGVCNLCCAGVRFFMARDKPGLIRFCPMQSETGQSMLCELGLPLEDYETFAVRDGNAVFYRSDAYLQLFRYLPYPWRLLGTLRIVPRTVRDWLYDRLAQNRYRLFGRRDRCIVPTPAQRARFI